MTTELTIEISGDVVERQELLNGTQIVTLEGRSADGRWTMTGLLSWNIGLEATAVEGDITLTRDDGAELFGSLVRGDVREGGDADASDADYRFRLEYEIDGGSGEFDGGDGTIVADGILAGETLEVRLTASAI